MTDLHWNLRDHLKEFRTDGRLYVLLSIYLHKNTRNRSWPSNELIANETGLSRAPISRSVKWLTDNHAVMIVPFEKRIGDEKKLPNRKNIYQLTGVIKINSVYKPYMYMTPEGWEGVIQELTDLGNSSLVELLKESDSLQIERLPSERLHSEPKGIKSSALSSSNKKTERQSLLEELTPHLTIAHCILVLIEKGYDGVMNRPEEYMTVGLMKNYLPHLQELARLAATTEELKGLYLHYKPLYEEKDWKFAAKTFADKLQPYRSLKKPKESRKPAPITDFSEPTAEERAALEAARKSIRPTWERTSEEKEAAS